MEDGEEDELSGDEVEDDEDNLFDNDYSGLTLTEILKMEEGETTQQKWLLAFYKYLQSLGGKALSAKDAKQHVRQILNMLNAIDRDADDIVCLTDDQGLRAW